MQKELKAEGSDVAFVAINSIDAVANQGDLTSKCEFPLFQDVDTVNAWTLHGGAKDDIFVYGSDGKLAHHLKYGGPIDTNLAWPEAYAAVKAIVKSTP